MDYRWHRRVGRCVSWGEVRAGPIWSCWGLGAELILRPWDGVSGHIRIGPMYLGIDATFYLDRYAQGDPE